MRFHCIYTQDSMEESHQGNELSNPTEWEKWTLNDNDLCVCVCVYMHL